MKLKFRNLKSLDQGHSSNRWLSQDLTWECLVLKQGCQTYFHRGPHQPHGCLQRVEITLGLYKCNYSLTVKELKLLQPFECELVPPDYKEGSGSQVVSHQDRTQVSETHLRLLPRISLTVTREGQSRRNGWLHVAPLPTVLWPMLRSLKTGVLP